jgi:bifunctional non-homologous end joining protein LigD
MGLKEYRRKRDFARTPEPDGKASAATSRAAKATAETKAHMPAATTETETDAPAAAPAAEEAVFVVQKHQASHLHYDFRLQAQGVLISWAVPKGPSLDPKQKRLAVRTEDHPLAYGDFEGTIPEGQYGGGAVMLWDTGTVRYDADQGAVAAAIDERKAIAFELRGRKLAGRWRLVPFNTAGEKPRNWLLIKSRDEAARDDGDILAEAPHSAVTGRSLDEIVAANRPWNHPEASYGD